MYRSEAIKLLKTYHFLLKGYKWHIAGSIRRKCNIVSDIDIVMVGDGLKWYIEAIKRLDINSGLYMRAREVGKKRVRIHIQGGELLDIAFVEAWDNESWNPMLLFYTGSKNFNIRMRIAAQKHGYKLNEYGLFKDDQLIATKEHNIFQKLGMQYVEPSERR